MLVVFLSDEGSSGLKWEKQWVCVHVVPGVVHWKEKPGPRFNVKMSYQYRDFLYKEKTVMMALCKTAVTPVCQHWSYCSLALSHPWPSHHYKGNSCIGKTISLYWNSTLVHYEAYSAKMCLFSKCVCFSNQCFVKCISFHDLFYSSLNVN